MQAAFLLIVAPYCVVECENFFLLPNCNLHLSTNLNVLFSPLAPHQHWTSSTWNLGKASQTLEYPDDIEGTWGRKKSAGGGQGHRRWQVQPVEHSPWNFKKPGRSYRSPDFSFHPENMARTRESKETAQSQTHVWCEGQPHITRTKYKGPAERGKIYHPNFLGESRIPHVLPSQSAPYSSEARRALGSKSTWLRR